MTLPARNSFYHVLDGAIAATNSDRVFNRPIYLDHNATFVLAGDRPTLFFARDDVRLGTFAMMMVRGRSSRWLHDFRVTTVAYQPGRVAWHLSDPAFPGMAMELKFVAEPGGRSFLLRVQMSGGRPDDRLTWIYGGALREPGRRMNWDFDPHARAKTPGPFDFIDCPGSTVTLGKNGATTLTPMEPGAKPSFASSITCDHASDMSAEGTAILSKCEMGPKNPASGPIAHGETTPRNSCIHWRVTAEEQAPRAPPADAFASSEAFWEARRDQLTVKTPEPRLDALAGMAVTALDGAWHPPMFRHGAMLWNIPLLGWRTLCGATCMGWHSRVAAAAAYYLPRQIRESGKVSALADPALLLTEQDKRSRFYGRGRIDADQMFYDMQSQFFDQLIHAWRWTGSKPLGDQLRPAIELHAEWMQDCFERDGEGVYESYINTWPTDSVWYGGGTSPDATTYAYSVHRAARDLATLAGDEVGAARHATQIERIRQGFNRHLWNARLGHPGLYREGGGERRLHDDAWLYNVFLPVDADLLTWEQAVTSLYYTQWALQNDRMPCGGRTVWTSNFVPGIWSVRENWPGDNYHLALAFFKTGLAEEGWDIFRGTFIHTAFDQLVPGDLGARNGGTDFGDCAHMFVRSLIEGLFGFRPDYPNGTVVVAPQFPEDWNHASIRTSDNALDFYRKDGTITLAVSVAHCCTMEFRVPVAARRIVAVQVDGAPTPWKLSPGIGRSLLQLTLPERRTATVVIHAEDTLNTAPALTMPAIVGRPVTLRCADGPIAEFRDPQSALHQPCLGNGVLTAEPRFAGRITVLALVMTKGGSQWRLFHLVITDPAIERRLVASPVPTTETRWHHVAINRHMNADVRTIFQQAYVSPRPDTVSVQIGSDGYSPWTFSRWKAKPPVIGLDNIPSIKNPTGGITTSNGVPFAWCEGKSNVAFTSQWDNFPRGITVPVGLAGEAVWFLVCGSTNPMQGRIANAILRLRYADDTSDCLELVPPFNYWNLCAIDPNITTPGQVSRTDYTAATDRFAVPQPGPLTCQLGENCRAVVLCLRLKKGSVLASVTLETLSQDVVVGLMGITIMNPEPSS